MSLSISVLLLGSKLHLLINKWTVDVILGLIVDLETLIPVVPWQLHYMIIVLIIDLHNNK